MLIADKLKYSPELLSKFLNAIENAQNDFGSRVLFGSIVSSVAMGTNNRQSDVDVLLVLEGKGRYKTVFQDGDDVFDVDAFGLETLSRNMGEYRACRPPFPSVINRDGLSARSYELERSSLLRIFEVLISDCVFDEGFLRSNLEELVRSIQLMDVFDYYCSRAYGNLRHHLNQETVPAVRYVRTAFGIGVLEHLLARRDFPKGAADFIIQNYIDRQYRPFLLNALRVSRDFCGILTPEHHIPTGETETMNGIAIKKTKAEKNVATIPINREINRYFESMLQSIVAKVEAFGEQCLIPNGESLFFRANRSE